MSQADKRDRLVVSLDLDEINAIVGSVETRSASAGTDTDAALAERMDRANDRIQSYIDEAMGDDDLGPSGDAHAVAEREGDAGSTLHAMRARWLAQTERVARLSMENRNFPEKARKFIWSIYLRQKKIKSIDEAIFVFNLALFYFGESEERISSDDYWKVFFRKIQYSIDDVYDENGFTLPDYISIHDEGTIVFLIPCIEELADWAMRQPEARTKTARDLVKRTFTAPRGLLARSILDRLRAAIDPDLVRRAEAALAALSTADAAATAENAADDPDAALIRLVSEGKKREAIDHARKHARNIRPQTVAEIFEKTRIDLFRVDIGDRGEGENRRGRLLQGALTNHFAKSGLYSTDHARLRLVREKTGLSQGRVDARGWNNYMQIAAQRDYNPAFIENEHAFWDHMFTQMATDRAGEDADEAKIERLELAIARDLLDRPDNTGMNAFLLAARAGATMALKYIVNRLISFRAFRAYSQAVAQPGQSTRSAAALKQAYIAEIQENLPYILAADKSGANAFMHALQNNRSDSISVLLAHLRDAPEYMRFIAKIKIPLDNRKIGLSEYCAVDFGHGRNTEAQRMLQRVLADAARQAGG